MKKNWLTYIIIEEASDYFRCALLTDVDDIVFSVYSIARVVKRLVGVSKNVDGR
jgi:hypothetical protein